MRNEFIVKTLGQIQGYRTRLKELHWSSPNLKIHELVADMTKSLETYEDSLAELSIALWGEIEPGELAVKSSEDYSLKDLLNTLHGKAIEIKRECNKQGLLWSGLESITDSFIVEVETIIFKVNMESKNL